jgi:uncharacterized protein (TIGR04255 family)
MPFQPKSGAHAIIEVVFGLYFARAFTSTELDALAKAHPLWKEDLPKIARGAFGGGFQLMVAEGVGPMMPIPMQGGGVIFESIKRDGSLDWRVRAEGNGLFVNCLAYEGGVNTWAKAKRYIERAADHMGINLGEQMVSSCSLEYIDLFDWEGDVAGYDLEQLLRRNSRYIPATVWERGPMWHLYQGWFRSENIPDAKRLLERIHLDGVLDASGVPTVKFDTFMQVEFAKSVSVEHVIATKNENEGIFPTLHALNKRIISDYITQEMADRIRLNAPGGQPN